MCGWERCDLGCVGDLGVCLCRYLVDFGLMLGLMHLLMLDLMVLDLPMLDLILYSDPYYRNILISLSRCVLYVVALAR